MLSFIARNGGVGVRGVERGGGAAASALQYIHHDGGPALPPRPGAAGTASPWALGAGGGWVCPLRGGHHGTRVDGGQTGYCVSAMGAAGSRRAKYCT